MTYNLSNKTKYSARYSYTNGTTTTSRTISGINISYVDSSEQTVYNPNTNAVFTLLDDVMGTSSYTISKRYFVNEREVTYSA